MLSLGWTTSVASRGLTAFAFLRDPARTQERPRRHCISPRSALARSLASTYVHVARETQTHPRTHTYARLTRHSEVRWKPRTLFSESIESLHRPASGHLRSGRSRRRVCVYYARFALRNNNAASRRPSWTATARVVIPRAHRRGRSSRRRTPKCGTEDILMPLGLICTPSILSLLYHWLLLLLPILFFFFPVISSLTPRSLFLFLSFLSLLVRPSPSTCSPFFLTL